MFPETKPIIFDTEQNVEEIEIYPIHDLHYGNPMFDSHKWNALVEEILDKPHRYCVWVGDLMENAVPGSKSNPLEQLHSPLEQREFVTAAFRQLKDRTLAIVDGNHEFNRSTRMAGLYPLYDSACIAGIEDRYRSAFCVLDIGVGGGYNRHPENPFRYAGFLTHKAKDMKNFCTADFLEGFDFVLFGHDHDPKDHSRGKLVYNRMRHTVSVAPVEVINCGSFLSYGGYAVRGGYRPQSSKMYKLILSGKRESIQTVGFYV